MNNARMFGSQEDPCASGTHGRTGTPAAKRARQLYANSTIREWQRAHPTLQFTDQLALFRLAGKDYDRNRGRV